MKNIVWVIVVIVVIGLGAFLVFGGASFEENQPVVENTASDNVGEVVGTDENVGEEENAAGGNSVVTPGTYAVNPEASEFNWAGQKPFIDRYVNSGTIAVTEGTIEVGDTEASGSFTLDMNTLSVGLTATKPGQEGVLERHLKGERWFDVANHPTATFVITNVSPTENSDTTFEYTITGDLTMKGQTNEISFPARIFMTEDGQLRAEADTEIDRTLWGITAGSGNFFENLGDNLVDDMVALSFSIAATKEE